MNPRSHRIRHLDHYNSDSRGTTSISNDVSVTFLESKLTYDAIVCFSDETESGARGQLYFFPLTRCVHPYKSLGGHVSFKAHTRRCQPTQGGFTPRRKR